MTSNPGRRLRERVAARDRLLGAVVSSGMTVNALEDVVDFLVAFSVGLFRIRGVGPAAALMPFGNANELTWRLAREQVLPAARHCPVFLGVCAHDPTLDLDRHLEAARQAGVVGIANYPTVGSYDGDNREMVEADGVRIDDEIALLARARAAGFVTMAFCLTAADAAAFVRRGVDILCVNLGPAEWRTLEGHAHQAALDRALARVDEMIDAARAVDPGVYCLASGGPLIMPQDASMILQRTAAQGYMGGSSIERLPATTTIEQTARAFGDVVRAGPAADRLGAMVGAGPAMQKVFDEIRRVAESDASVLIVGESGIGKELAAREIHRLGPLHDRPLVSWNCGATPESLAMSELFGHERGSFTGAMRTHIGKFELASGGTLFMDEVTDLPLAAQAALLRVLQEKEVVRVGGEKTIRVDARVIAATNREPRDLVAEDRFRLDLYYRLSTFVIRMPPLRDRPEDIPLLVREVGEELARKYGRQPLVLSDAALTALIRHPWPGNIRELRNVVERLMLLQSRSGVSPRVIEEMLAADRELGVRLWSAAAGPQPQSMAARRARLREVLAQHGGNKTAAARALGVAPKTIHKWLRQEG